MGVVVVELGSSSRPRVVLRSDIQVVGYSERGAGSLVDSCASQGLASSAASWKGWAEVVTFDGFGILSAKHSGKVLDVRAASAAAGAPLQQWVFLSNQANQRFRLDRLNDGFYRITALHSGKVLDVASGAVDNGAAVIQWDWHGGDNQRFAVENLGDHFILRAKHSGKVLDVAGASRDQGAAIIQWDRHGGPNQQWRYGKPID